MRAPSRTIPICIALFAALLCTAARPTQAAERRLRVLAPAVTIYDPVQEYTVGSYLARRLGQCPGVELVQSDRANRLSKYLRSDAFVYTDAQRWERFDALIDIDAMVSLHIPQRNDGSDGPVTAVVLTEKGTQTITIEYDAALLEADASNGRDDPDTAFVDAVEKMAVKVGKAIGLGEADLAVLSDTGLDDTTSLRTVEKLHVYPMITQHRQLSETAAILAPGEPNTPHSHELDAAALKLAHNVVTAEMRNRSPSLIIRAYQIGRTGAFNLLATDDEYLAYPLMVLEPDDYTKYPIRETHKLLIDTATPLKFGSTIGNAAEELEALEGLEDLAFDHESEHVEVMEAPTMVGTRTGRTEFTDAQRAGALRLLGLMRAKDGLPLIEKVAQRDDASLRAAAAFSLSGYRGEDGIATLKTLARDKDAVVAFTAAYGLWQRDQKPKGIEKQAAKLLSNENARVRRSAADVLLTAGTSPAVLRQLAASDDASIRTRARRRLLESGSPNEAELLDLLTNADAQLVTAALKLVPDDRSPALADAVRRLTADVDANVAWQARDLIEADRPSDARGSMAFNLDTGHLFVRHRIVERLRTLDEAWAVDLLASACDNDEAHTRMYALAALTQRAVDRARPKLVAALSDPHLLVRLRAASLLADCATAAEADGIASAISDQHDRATQLYLADALACATGKPLPAQQPAARLVDGKRNLSWLCGAGAAGSVPEAVDSPYDAYYMMGVNPDAGWKRNYESSKKIYIGRAVPIGDPTPIPLDAVAQDEFWLTLDAELEAGVPWLDGVLYGEETMQMVANRAWGQGWRIFCADAGIDHERVAGSMENLTPAEAQAFKQWGMTRTIEGFNRLYEYTKLKYGKLKPGFQVATFMGEQGLWDGPNVADFGWKFDIGGVYHYFGDSRKNAYALVRRYQTIWPDRPVIWLSHGIGVYERTPIKHGHKAPDRPVNTRYWRCYLDGVTAWLAGADTGWFSIWGFMDKDWDGGGISQFKGPTITPESIVPGNPTLMQCINYSFAGVDEMIRAQEEIDKVSSEEIDMAVDPEDEALDDMIDNLDGEAKDDAIAQTLDERKHAMYVGFHLYRNYLFDIARLFKSMPRQRYHADTLVVDPIQNVWYGSLDMPGADLAPQFDFFIDVNKVRHVDLSRYRVICVQTPELLEDGTIKAITDWLRDTPGVLYINIDLTADNTRERGSVADHDGMLSLDWPWEGDIALSTAKPAAPKGTTAREAAKAPIEVKAGDSTATVPRSAVLQTYEAQGDRATVTATAAGLPVQVLWRHPDYKGAVVFDGLGARQSDDLNRLRAIFNPLAEQGIGRKFDAPGRHIIIDHGDYMGIASNYAPERGYFEGVEAISGDSTPNTGPGNSVGIVVRKWRSDYLAAGGGVTVLAQKKIDRFEATADGVIVETAGAFRAGGLTGRLTAKYADGRDLPVIEPVDAGEWLTLSDDPGVAELPTRRGVDGGSMLIVRGKGAVLLTQVEPLAKQ